MHSDPQTLDESPATCRATRTFPARFSIVPETARFVEGFCERHGIGRQDRLRLSLIVEELVANTILHGHRGETEAPIVIALGACGDGVVLHYEDTAPAFDFAEALASARELPETDFDTRPVGKLGLRLLAHYAGTVRHVHEGGRNRVTLTLRCSR